MRISPGRLLSSVRSSASKLIAKGTELKDAVVPVLTGPVKPPRAYFYCVDGSTVLGPLSPDALYKLAWLHETVPRDVPVCLDGTDQWVPFCTLEDKLFSKPLVKEVEKIRAERAAEERRLAAIEQRRRSVRKVLIASAVALVLTIGFMILSTRTPVVSEAVVRPTSAITAPSPPPAEDTPSPTAEPSVAATPVQASEYATDSGATIKPTSDSPDTNPYYYRGDPTRGVSRAKVATPSPAGLNAAADEHRDTVYVQGHWVNGYDRRLPAGEHPTATASPAVSPSPTPYTEPVSTSGSGYVNGYYRKNGTYVHGYTRGSGSGHHR